MPLASIATDIYRGRSGDSIATDLSTRFPDIGSALTDISTSLVAGLRDKTLADIL